MFLDDKLIVELYGISKLQTRPRKHPNNPIIRADKPWEMGANPDLGSVSVAHAILYDEEEKIFKIWFVIRAAPFCLSWKPL